MSMFDKFRTPTTFELRRYRDCEDRPRRLKAQFLSLLTILSGAGYLIWLFQNYNRDYPFAGGVFFFAELCCLLLFVLATIGLWRVRFKPMEGIPPKTPYSVDVFVTTYNEPLRYLRKTLQAASRIEYDGVIKVHVLDDGGRNEVEALAAKFGLNYLSREKSGVERENAKSGNLNFGLRLTSGDLILTLDADQVPQPDIVRRIVGYLDYPKVAFIQTKQEYYTQSGDPFYNKSQVFYDVVQLALDNNDNAFSAGTGVLYRREALEDIGGFVEWNIVEDLTTSYELHSKGWKSFYFPHALSRGLAPTSIWGVYQQRGQWALDTMRLFIWDSPLFKRGLNFLTRIGYGTVAFSYICSAFIFPFFFLIPIWTYITGNTLLAMPEWQFLVVRSIYLMFMVAATHYLAFRMQPGKQFRMLAGLFPIYMIGIIRTFKYPKGRKPGYCVNNTLSTSPQSPSFITGTFNACLSYLKNKPPVLGVLPQLTILVLNLVMPFVALFLETCEPRVIAANIFVSAIAIWCMSQVVFSALIPGDFEPDEDPEHAYRIET